MKILDWRDRRGYEPVRGVRKVALLGGRPVVRKVSAIDSVVLHQTAIRFAAPKRAYDKSLARHARALGVACHALAFDDGVGVLAAPVRWHVNGANSLNPRSLHLEVEGSFPGLARLRAPRHNEVTPLLIETACETLRRLVEAGRAEGCQLRYVLAHRQSSDTRRADPGEELWRALEPVARTLGLTPLPDLVSREGRALPPEWCESGTAAY